MRAAPLAMLCVVLAVGDPAVAAPAASSTEAAVDPRVRTLTYDAQQVYRIVGVLRSATQILFGPGEEVQHVAIGDASAWEVAPQGDVLFLKPTRASRPTNLLVTTRKGEANRHYAFELAVRPGPMGRETRDTFFQVRFRYPADAQASLERKLSAEAAVLDAAILRLKLERGVLEGRRNLSYRVQGSPGLAPSEVSDNGRFTVLRFPGAQPLPAIYSVSADGAEALVPFDVRGEYVVVHGVVAQLRLRRGGEVACLWNQAFTPYGNSTGTGTAASDVERLVRPGGQR